MVIPTGTLAAARAVESGFAASTAYLVVFLLTTLVAFARFHWNGVGGHECLCPLSKDPGDEVSGEIRSERMDGWMSPTG
jgi:hypothetical protein